MDQVKANLRNNITKAKLLISNATEWTPALQMVREQQHVAECILDALENDRVIT